MRITEFATTIAEQWAQISKIVGNPNIPIASWVAIVEQHVITNSILHEAIDPSTQTHLQNLADKYNKNLRVGEKYIPIPVQLIHNMLQVFDSVCELPATAPATMCTLIKMSESEFTVTSDSGKTFTWPNSLVRPLSYSTMIFAKNRHEYDEIRSWLRLSLNVSLPESYQPPSLDVGDEIKKGKFKNSPAVIKGFKKDKHNQPVLKTNKGDVQLFKPRITKLMKEEIIDEYENGTDNSRQIFAKLKQLGYERIGSGQDATVWSKDEQSVIKILMPTDKPYNAENGFLTFYGFCQQHKDLPNLPKFVEIGGAHHTVFTMNGTNYRQIAMERLQPIPLNSFESAMIWILSDLASTRIQWRVLLSKLLESDSWGETPLMQEMPHLIMDRISDESFNASYSLLLLTMQSLYAVGKQAGLGWDLHEENVMQRRDGTLVIVDPFYS